MPEYNFADQILNAFSLQDELKQNRQKYEMQMAQFTQTQDLEKQRIAQAQERINIDKSQYDQTYLANLDKERNDVKQKEIARMDARTKELVDNTIPADALPEDVRTFLKGKGISPGYINKEIGRQVLDPNAPERFNVETLNSFFKNQDITTAQRNAKTSERNASTNAADVANKIRHDKWIESTKKNDDEKGLKELNASLSEGIYFAKKNSFPGDAKDTEEAKKINWGGAMTKTMDLALQKAEITGPALDYIKKSAGVSDTDTPDVAREKLKKTVTGMKDIPTKQKDVLYRWIEYSTWKKAVGL